VKITRKQLELDNPISTSTRNVIVGVALVGGLVAFAKLVL
jgi:hypothetical protein